MLRLPHIAAALGAAAAMAGGCGDEPTAPDENVSTPLAVSDRVREQMRLALLFAESGANQGVGASFAALAMRVERNDRMAVEREIDVVRTALHRYREGAGGNGAADPELEALMLTLDQVAALATRSPSAEDPRP